MSPLQSSSVRSSKVAQDEASQPPPPPDYASDMLVPSADSAAGMGTPCDPDPGSSKVSVSTYVRETATAVCTLFEEVPAVGAVCKTLLSVEKLVGTAKVNKDELEVLLELCDVVTRGFLDRCSAPCVPLERVSSLRRHVDSAKRVTALCNKGRFARFALGRKISRNITSVKTNVVNFATVNNLALSGDLHVSHAGRIYCWRYLYAYQVYPRAHVPVFSPSCLRCPQHSELPVHHTATAAAATAVADAQNQHNPCTLKYI